MKDQSDQQASWTMTWDVDGGPVDEGESATLPSLRLPQGKVLVAHVEGESSPGSTERRSTALCVGAGGDYVVRTLEGAPIWSDAGPGGAPRALPLPVDWGGECQAMIDGAHLVEWLNCIHYLHEGGRLTGTGEYYGAFEAALHDIGLVLRVDVGLGRSHERRLIEVQAWGLLDDAPGLLRPVHLDVLAQLP